MNKELTDIYYNSESPAYLARKRGLELELQKKGKKLTNEQLSQFLLGETAFNIFKYPRKKFPRRPIIIKAPYETISCDLGDLQSLKRFNKASWLFLIVDNFSKFN